MANWFKHAFFVFLRGRKLPAFATIMRLLAVLSIFALFRPSQFVEAKREILVTPGQHLLPTPVVRFVKLETASSVAATPLPDFSFPEYSREIQDDASFEMAAPGDGFQLVVGASECVPWRFCEQRPGLEIWAAGLLNGSKITKIQVQVGEQGKIFDGDRISIRLPVTQRRGDWLNYWAVAENGSQSPVYSIKYLSYKRDGELEDYYFALLGAEWSDGTPYGSLLWNIFPPVGAEFPQVLEQPLSAGYLHTTNRYGYLAGKLILSGRVQARTCDDGGIYPNGYATPCGEKLAAEKVLEWQNRYDEQIYASSVQNQIPARILKAMIAQETQFWPVSKSAYEIGLGSLTENGVEMLLAWNKDYFLNLCTIAYGKKMCAGGFFHLRADRRIALQRSVWEKTLAQKEEIDILGATLFASAAQVNQMVKNTKYASPGEVASYEDMWRITVANYHSGSGCIGTGMMEVARNQEPFTWKTISSYLLGDCKQAISYVDNVWRYAGGQP